MYIGIVKMQRNGLCRGPFHTRNNCTGCAKGEFAVRISIHSASGYNTSFLCITCAKEAFLNFETALNSLYIPNDFNIEKIEIE